jgi:hypothetical protein
LWFSAAHCFYNDVTNKKEPAHIYEVAVSKFFRAYGNEDDRKNPFMQIREVKQYYLYLFVFNFRFLLNPRFYKILGQEDNYTRSL